MSAARSQQQQDNYSLGHSPQEYERLRLQARMWEAAAVRLLDQVGVPLGASCLDAGCGPGETMRLMAERTGPSGRVLGLDADAPLGALALEMLREEGHWHCDFRAHDLTADEPIPGGPFDLVYARLVLIHLPQRLQVLARLWDAVAPGGHLVIQDYDLTTPKTSRRFESMDEMLRVMCGAFTAAGCDVQMGVRLPLLFAEAGIGSPDGTDVAGLVRPFTDAATVMRQVNAALLPAAVAHGITTEADFTAALAALDRDTAEFGDHPSLFPLMIGAWKRKDPS